MNGPRPPKRIDRVAVLGAGGITGRAILRGLRGKVVTRAITRDSSHAPALLEAGATETAVGDFSDTDSLKNALAGIDAVYVICPQFSAAETTYVSNALAAASAAGVRRFVYHSVLHPNTPAMRHHVRKSSAEALVRDSRLSWTILQPGMYAETVRMMMVRSGDSGSVKLPYRLDTLFSLVAIEDVAEVAAEVLTQPGHEFAQYEVCGPEPRPVGECVQELAAVLGKTIVAEHVSVADGPYADHWGPSSIADAAAMWAYYDSHGLVGNPHVLQSILKRPARSFADAVSSGIIGH